MPSCYGGGVLTGSDILQTAARYYQAHLTDERREFLRTRYGLTADFVKDSQIGYAPHLFRDGVYVHLRHNGFSHEEIIRTGLSYEVTSPAGKPDGRDLFRGRLMFPYLVAGVPVYFIGRQTDHTPEIPGRDIPKYVKQIVREGGFHEPIFGQDSVIPGEPLIITEGITDALIVLQSGYSCISPVTTGFKETKVQEMVEHCRKASAVYIINDNENSGAGLKGAVKTALSLHSAGIVNYIGELPRPAGVDKVDMNDFIRGGGDLVAVLQSACNANDHPALQEERRTRRREQSGYRQVQTRRRLPGPYRGKDDIGALKQRMPSVSEYSGIPLGKRGSHPVYGSATGNNFQVNADGETWTSYHANARKGGDILKLIALEQGFLADETLPLRGDAFLKTKKYCEERWPAETSKQHA